MIMVLKMDSIATSLENVNSPRISSAAKQHKLTRAKRASCGATNSQLRAKALGTKALSLNSLLTNKELSNEAVAMDKSPVTDGVTADSRHHHTRDSNGSTNAWTLALHTQEVDLANTQLFPAEPTSDSPHHNSHFGVPAKTEQTHDRGQSRELNPEDLNVADIDVNSNDKQFTANALIHASTTLGQPVSPSMDGSLSEPTNAQNMSSQEDVSFTSKDTAEGLDDLSSHRAHPSTEITATHCTFPVMVESCDFDRIPETNEKCAPGEFQPHCDSEVALPNEGNISDSTGRGSESPCVDQILTSSAQLKTQLSNAEQLLGAADTCLNQTQEMRQYMLSLKEELVSKRKSVAVELDNMFREIEFKLQERKMVLFTSLTDCSYPKECYLDDQLHRMESIEAELLSLVDKVHKVKSQASEATLCSVVDQELKVSAELLEKQSISLNSFRLTENTYLKFTHCGLPDVRKSLHTLAQVSGSDVIPSKCTVTGEGLKKCFVGRQSQAKVTLRNKQGHIEKEIGLQLDVELYKADVHVSCQSNDSGNGTFTVMFIAPEEGQYSLAIRLFDQHVKGSPFKITATQGSRSSLSPQNQNHTYQLTRLQDKAPRHSSSSSPLSFSEKSFGSLESFSSLKILPTSPLHRISSPHPPPYGDYLSLIGQYGRKKGEFTNPQGVCVSNSGLIYCSDSTNQNIQIFSENGLYRSRIEDRGRQPGQLLRPIGLCFTKDGTLVYTDYENKCINIVKDGTFVRRIGVGKLIGPKGVAESPTGTILVADNKGNAVLEFSIKGKLLRKIGDDKVNKAMQFAGPHYIAVNGQGNIYVTDFHNHCVRVFDAEGVYLRSFGHHGTGDGQFNAPTGICIDKEDHVLVADWGNSRIQVFDQTNAFLCEVNTLADPLFGPQSLCTMSNSRVIVCDSGNHCLKTFRYM